MKMNAPQSLKFSKLKRRLGIPHWQAVGLLESVWLFTQVNAPAGDIGRHADEDIAAAIEWEGNAVELIDTLTECGWLDKSDEFRLIVHDWDDHIPRYLKGALAKNGVEVKQSAKSVKQPAKRRKQPAPSQANPIQAKPNQDKPNQADCSAPLDAVPEPPAMEFPVKGSGQKTWDLHRSQLDSWDLDFPAVDVLAECRKARAWCDANPLRQKTPGGMRAFLVRWLSKAQDSSNSTPARSPPKTFRQTDRDEAFALLDAMTEKPLPAIAAGESDAA